MNPSRLVRAMKLIFAVFVFATLYFFWGFFRIEHKYVVTPMSDTELQRWYQGINEEYYANTLPTNTVVKWGDLTDQLSMGLTIHQPAGGYVILIDRATNPVNQTAVITLHHEICHITTPEAGLDSHGLKFQACMMRLAEQGAFKTLW